jgi:hypothetical protein
MKPCRIMVALVFCGLLAACSRDKSRAQGLSGPPQTGALYSLNDGEGGFRVGKVVATEEEVVFVRLFSDRWTSRPSLDKARTATLAASLAFSAQNFAGMQPMHLENGTVSPEELEAYEKWKQSNRDMF